MSMYVSAPKKQWAVTEQVGMQTIKSLLTTYVLKILYPKISDNQIVTRNHKLQHLIRVLGLSHHAPSKSPPAGRCCICIHVGWASKLHETITQPPMLNEHWEGCASYIEDDCFDCADVRQCSECGKNIFIAFREQTHSRHYLRNSLIGHCLGCLRIER